MTGAINGLDKSRGIAVATNGIIVAIMQNDGIVFGHLDWFVEDKEPACEASPALSTIKQISKRSKTNKLFDTF